jgi:RNA polymerase sigma factor (sigma-70 family)
MLTLAERQPRRQTVISQSRDNDRELIRACLAGHESAWHELVDRYGRLVYSIPQRLGLQASDADDVFQAVFLAVSRSLRNLQQTERLTSWIIRIAYRESWRVGRRVRRFQEMPALDPTAEATEDEMLQVERQHLLRQAMGRLRPKSRKLLDALYFGPSADYAQIARKLGYSIGSIGPLRARAFLELERELTVVGFDA